VRANLCVKRATSFGVKLSLPPIPIRSPAITLADNPSVLPITWRVTRRRNCYNFDPAPPHPAVTKCPRLPFHPSGHRGLVLVAILLEGCHPPAQPPTTASPAQTAEELTWSGIAKSGQKDFAGAAADFNAALALRPDDADVVYNLGLAQSAQKDYPGAIAAFTRALALTPGDAEILLSRGTAAFYE